MSITTSQAQIPCLLGSATIRPPVSSRRVCPGFVAQPGGFASTQSLTNHGRNIALAETHIFSPESINLATLGYNRIFNHILSYGSGSCESQKLGIPGANLGGISCGLTDTVLGSTFWALGDRAFAPFQGGTNVYFIKDSFDAVRGNHDIKFGGEVRLNQMNVMTGGFQDGFWIFTNLWTSAVANGSATGAGGNIMADFLLGLPDLALHDQAFQGPTTGRRWTLYRPYVQDDWRVKPNLTLNLGLAWAFVTPVREVFNRQSNFNLQTGQFLIAGKNASSTAGLSADKTALEPRIGLAWSPRGTKNLHSRGLRYLPRFVVEPGLAGLVAESSLLRGVGIRRFLPRSLPGRDREEHLAGVSASHPTHRSFAVPSLQQSSSAESELQIGNGSAVQSQR